MRIEDRSALTISGRGGRFEDGFELADAMGVAIGFGEGCPAFPWGAVAFLCGITCLPESGVSFGKLLPSPCRWGIAMFFHFEPDSSTGVKVIETADLCVRVRL